MTHVILAFLAAMIAAGAIFYISSLYRNKFLFRNAQRFGVSMHGEDIDIKLRRLFSRKVNRHIKKRSIGAP